MKTPKIKLLLVILVGFLSILSPFESQAQFNAEDSGVSAKFFPESKLDIHTPAFYRKGKNFTKYKTMMRWLEVKACEDSQMVSMAFIGKSQLGKRIPFLRITKKNGQPKTKIWIQGGLHGDEPAGTEVCLYLIDQFLTDPKLTAMLDKIELGILPMANIDGYDMGRRESANGMDLNRDQTRLSTPETKYLKAAFSKFDPAVALDLHEYRPYRKDFSRFSTRGISSIYDVMFLFSGNLNVPQNLRDYTKNTYVENAKNVLKDKGIRYTDYMTTQKYGGQVHFNKGSVHARSSASCFALANTVSTLLEIRGVGIKRTNFKRRIESGYLVCLSYITTAYNNQVALEKTLSEAASQKNDVVVKSDRKFYADTIPAIDIATNTEIQLPVLVHDALQSFPLLARKRPTAYLILPTAKRAFRNLVNLGITVDTLSEAIDLQVEAYAVKENNGSDDDDDQEEEDATSVETKNSTTTEKIQFPKGTFVVYMDQKRANLACEVLEPENANGFVATKVIKIEVGTRLPIFRYMLNEPISGSTKK